MEIEAVAESNNARNRQKRARFKTPMFPEQSILREPPNDSTLPKISDHFVKTDSFTASLLAISEAANTDFFRQKVRKRIIKDQFGPWLFHAKWSPRKRPSQHRSGDRLLYSSAPRFPSPDGRYSPRRKLNNAKTRFTSGHFYRGDGESWGQSQSRANDIGDHKSQRQDQGGKNKSPTTIYCTTSVPDHHASSIYKNGEEASNSIPKPNGTITIQAYQKHSLPTLITLKPADSSDSYDNVFSLGKSRLTRKDFIISMGQKSRIPNHHKRQPTSAMISGVDQAQNDDSISYFDSVEFPRNRGVPNNRGDDFHVVSMSESPSDRPTDTTNGIKSGPPMTEYQDISQHMRYYRMHHTVRLTGRFSLANDQSEQKERKSVQWNEVFPHRPLSNTNRSATTVPVFRFSVRDFQQQPLPSDTRSATRDSKDLSSKSPDYNTIGSASNSHRTSIPVCKIQTYYTDNQPKRDESKREKDARLSLSPTVRPVTKSPRTSLTLDGIDVINKWRSRSRSGSLRRRRSKSAESDSEHRYRYESDDFTHFNRKQEQYKDMQEDKDRRHDADGFSDDDDDKGRKLNTSSDKLWRGTVSSSREISLPSRFQPDDFGGWHSGDHKDKEERRGTTPTSHNLSKTQEYIKSSYSVYNDTIQNVRSPESGHGADYREFLKRKKKPARNMTSSLDNENSNEGDTADDSLPRDVDGQLMKTKYKSPHRFSHILKDIMGYPRSKTFYKSLESERKVEPKTRLETDDYIRRPSRSFDIDLRTPTVNRHRARPILTIDADRLRSSVDRKIHEGNKLLSRPITVSSGDYADNQRCVRFLVKEEQKTMQIETRRKFNSSKARETWRTYLRDELGTEHLNSVSDAAPQTNMVTASIYDLNAPDEIALEDSEGNLNENIRRKSASSSISSNVDGNASPVTSVMSTKKTWKPTASRWNEKPQSASTGSRCTSSAFHYRPTSSSASAAYVIAAPPSQMGFDDRGVVLPLDEFVQMAMKGRESSFSAWNHSVNAGSKLGIAPNTSGSRGSVRKSQDDGLVRVVSFATPVNQFIFAKRITGCPNAPSSLSASATNTAEEVGRSVFQRKATGSYRLSLNDADQQRKVNITNRRIRIPPKQTLHGVKEEESGKTRLSSEIKDLSVDGKGSEYLSSKDSTNTDVNEKEQICNIKPVEADDSHSGENTISQLETVPSHPCFDNGQESSSLKENITTRLDLRGKIIRLAEMKDQREYQETETGNGENLTSHQSISGRSEIPGNQNNKRNQESQKLLTSKFSELRRKRQKALRRSNIIKNGAIVRRSVPLYCDASDKESRSSGNAESTENTPSVDFCAEGRCPWKDNEVSEVSGSAARSVGTKATKTVRFACDESDGSHSSKENN